MPSALLSCNSPRPDLPVSPTVGDGAKEITATTPSLKETPTNGRKGGKEIQKGLRKHYICIRNYTF